MTKLYSITPNSYIAMKQKLINLLIAGGLVLFLAGCQKEYQPTGISELNYDLAIPIGHAEISLGDLLPVDNENILVNDDSSITFYFRQDSLFYFSVTDLLEIPAQPAETKVFKLGEISIEDFGPISSSVTLEDMLTQIDTIVAQTISALNGMNATIPAMTAEEPANYEFSDFDDFEYVTFSEGGLVLTIFNNLSIDFATMQLKIQTINNGTPIDIGTFSIQDLMAGTSALDTIYLEGVTLYNDFSLTLEAFSTYATPNPVPVDLEDELYVGISSYDLKVIAGKAKLPQQQLEGLDEVVSFDVTEEERLTHLLMQSGRIAYNLVSNFTFNFNFNLNFPTATINGNPLSYPISSSGTTSGNFDLSGADFDFSTIPAQAYNQLPVSISLETSGAEQWVEFDSASTLTLSYGFEDIMFDEIHGWVGNKSIELAKDTILFDIAQLANLSGTMEFADPKINLLLTSNIGVPVGLNLGLVNHSVSGSLVDLGLSQLALPYPTIPGTFVEEKITISNANSNLSTFLSTIPQELFIEGLALTNPASDVNNPDYTNFITSDAELNLGIEIELPFALRMQDLRFRDTMNINLNSSTVEGFESGLLSILTANGLPFEIDLNLVFFDSITNRIVDTLFIDLINPAQVDGNGVVTQATEKHTELSLTNEELMNLSEANKVAIDALVNTSEGGTQHVVFYTDYILDIRLGLRVNYNLNVDNE